MNPTQASISTSAADGIGSTSVEQPEERSGLSSPRVSVISLSRRRGGLWRGLWDRAGSNGPLLFFGGAAVGALLMWTVMILGESSTEYVALSHRRIWVTSESLADLAILYAGPRPTEDSYPAKCDVFDEDGNFLGVEIHWKRIVNDGEPTRKAEKISSRIVRIGNEPGGTTRRYRD